MYRTQATSEDRGRSVVHRPAPRAIVYAAMVFLMLVVAPAYVLEPARSLGGGGIVGLAMLLAFELLLFSIARRRVVLTVDEHQLNVTILSVRWPLPLRRTELRVADVRAVMIQKAPRGTSMRVALALQSGGELPLTASYFGNTGQMDRDAAQIRALCGLAAS